MEQYERKMNNYAKKHNCPLCLKNKIVKSIGKCLKCRDIEYQKFTNVAIEEKKIINNPCYFCKKEISYSSLDVRVSKKRVVKMHKSCNTKRLNQLKAKKKHIENPFRGGTASGK